MIKNKAFTMSEALIVLGIIAVLAALSVVAITNSKPDENIQMFRRAYSTTAKIVQDLMNDKDLYPDSEKPSEDSALGSVANFKGLLDNSFSDNMKSRYPYLSCNAGDQSCFWGRKFIDTFMHKANALSSSTTSYTKSNWQAHISNYKGTMTTSDGLYWIVNSSYRVVRGPLGVNEKKLTVVVYTNGDDTDKSCVYNADSCPYPTAFKFNIARNGQISVNDPMACSYLRYPKAVRNSQIPTDPTVNSCFSATYSNTDEEEDDDGDDGEGD